MTVNISWRRHSHGEYVRILHIITGLNNGGAEGVLYRLAVTDKEDTHQVISLTDSGMYGPMLNGAGVPVHTLGLSPRSVSAGALLKLYRLIRSIDADAIQTWMYHADLLGGMIGRLAGNKTIVWGIQNSTFDRATTPSGRRRVARICAWLSLVIPRKIVSVSYKGARIHGDAGYRRDKIVVIPNGYDLDRFAPLPDERERLRNESGILPGTPLIGMVARWDFQKDHGCLIAALGQLKKSGTGFHCWLVGPEINDSNADLIGLLELHGARSDVSLLGSRQDIPAIMNALDIHVLSSVAGEGFPNVVAEAMACGTPCVATDVGDSRLIVGETGWVVPPRAPGRIAAALEEAIAEIENSEQWHVRQDAARQRIVTRFALSRMVDRYREVWAAAADAGRRETAVPAMAR